MVTEKPKKKRAPKKKAGRPTVLNEKLALEIRGLILSGLNYKKIQAQLKIPAGTWDEWVTRNYQGFREKLTNYHHDYLLSLAEKNFREILTVETKEQAIGMFGPIFDKKTKKPVMKVNDKLLAIKERMSEFIGETIGRKRYTKKLELDDVSKPKKLIILKGNGTRRDDISGTV